ncbi:RDD family protein [Cellulomonas hominis]
MDARDGMGSWLEGSAPCAATSGPAGARLGLPASGPGSLAPLGRRVAALMIDWLACLGISTAFFGGDPVATLVVFAVENVLLVGTAGYTLGHWLLGLRVRRVTPPATLGQAPAGVVPDAGPDLPPGLLAGVIRTVLLCLVIPAAVWDADGRGLHDRSARTALIRR